MIGALSLGEKAVTFGYKRYGVPGAIASGGVALAGYVAVRRALRSATNADEDTLESAIDTESLTDAVEQEGLEAVTDVQTLDDVIDEEQLRSAVDETDVSSSVGEVTDEFTGETDDSSASDHLE
ncbi:hypothetical protein [Natronorubrum bangense]|uniref:Uncharacterized protein n=2 Tax=Natronorubrum bangense TaxID=61858 RepID=L9WJU4_9EURY|nr:hypothetical protein [Natronorubrum bangense]ELY49765.1 hypothetical protein C494_07120 [Natronorubrum bangense JCM 10635]QCC55392.1 hypothetical protein DV706_13510 [Natronorubrum bangense]